MSWLISEALMQDYASSLSSQEQAEEFSEVVSSVGIPFAPWNGNLMPRAFLSSDRTTEFSDPSLSGLTFAPLTDDLGRAVLTWFLVVSRARTSAAQDAALGSPVNARDYGRTWHGLSAKWNRDRCSWKTPHSLWDEGWMSSLPTLPRWGSMLDGALWERRTLTRLINGTESGSLPTPVKYDIAGRGEADYYRGLGWQARYNWSNDPDADVIPHVTMKEKIENRRRKAGETLPTPLAGNAKMRGLFDVENKQNGLPAAVHKRQMQQWPAPMTGGLRGGSGAPKDLEQRIRMRVTLPTPIRNDAKASGSDAAGRQGGQSLKQRVRFGTPTVTNIPRRDAFKRNTPSMAEVVVAERKKRIQIETPNSSNGLRGGSQSANHPMMWGAPGDEDYGELNPIWVSWIMGWPIGWTSLEPMPLDDFERWQLMITAGKDASVVWWHEDPSELEGPAHIPRTCPKSTQARVEQIAALGNGQVSAVAAAAYIYLSNLEFPKEKA